MRSSSSDDFGNTSLRLATSYEVASQSRTIRAIALSARSVTSFSLTTAIGPSFRSWFVKLVIGDLLRSWVGFVQRFRASRAAQQRRNPALPALEDRALC